MKERLRKIRRIFDVECSEENQSVLFNLRRQLYQCSSRQFYYIEDNVPISHNNTTTPLLLSSWSWVWGKGEEGGVDLPKSVDDLHKISMRRLDSNPEFPEGKPTVEPDNHAHLLLALPNTQCTITPPLPFYCLLGYKGEGKRKEVLTCRRALMKYR